MTGKTIEDFCWSVIFELRQPMTAISGHAQRAQHLMHTDPLRARDALDSVVEQIARIDQVLVELYERERRALGTTNVDGRDVHRAVREGVKT